MATSTSEKTDFWRLPEPDDEELKATIIEALNRFFSNRCFSTRRLRKKIVKKLYGSYRNFRESFVNLTSLGWRIKRILKDVEGVSLIGKEDNRSERDLYRYQVSERVSGKKTAYEKIDRLRSKIRDGISLGAHPELLSKLQSVDRALRRVRQLVDVAATVCLKNIDSDISNQFHSITTSTTGKGTHYYLRILTSDDNGKLR